MKKIFLLTVFIGLLTACKQDGNGLTANDRVDIQTASILPVTGNSSNFVESQGEVWLESLITDTPQEGRELAIKMARKTIGAIQSDPEVKKKLRKSYAEDAGQLILSAQVVATEFQTVAEANNYWRDK